MAAGDLTASAPVFVDCNDGAAIKAAIDALNLPLVTDELVMETVFGGKKFVIFKVTRAAS